MRAVLKLAALAALALAPWVAIAQSYPERPVRLIVPFAAGGSTDVVFRALSTELARHLGQPVVIDNRPGGGATIGMNAVAKAAPDGYTLGVATLSFAANPSFLKERVPFSAENDFEPVTLVARMPLVLTVHPSVPARTAAELVAYARQHPGVLNYGSTGIASSGHLGGALLESQAGIRLMHIPYSSSFVVGAIVSGEMQVLVGPLPSSLPFVQTDRLIPLGVTSSSRAPALPHVPTLAEAGIPGIEAYEWSGLVAPKGTPEAVVQKVQQAVVAALGNPGVRESIQRTGAETIGGTPREFSAFIRSELARWSRIAADIQAREAPAR